MIKYYEIVRSVIIAPISIPNDELNFKLEVLHDREKGYFSRLYRLENYNLNPSFEQKDLIANEAIYVLDTHSVLTLDDKYHKEVEDCLNFSIQEISEKFSH